MGCDIHAHVEVKSRERWYHEASFDIRRNYTLFQILAGVRASMDIEPISEPRGLPDDVCWTTKSKSDEWGDDGHSHSWVTIDELESYPLDRHVETDLVECSWDDDGNATGWCKWTSGESRPAKPIHLESWAGAAMGKLIAILKAHKIGNDDVRLVFWFDN